MPHVNLAAFDLVLVSYRRLLLDLRQCLALKANCLGPNPSVYLRRNFQTGVPCGNGAP